MERDLLELNLGGSGAGGTHSESDPELIHIASSLFFDFFEFFSFSASSKRPCADNELVLNTCSSSLVVFVGVGVFVDFFCHGATMSTVTIGSGISSSSSCTMGGSGLTDRGADCITGLELGAGPTVGTGLLLIVFK